MPLLHFETPQRDAEDHQKYKKKEKKIKEKGGRGKRRIRTRIRRNKAIEIRKVKKKRRSGCVMCKE